MANGLITEHEAAEFLAVSVKTLRRWRCVGLGPRWIRLGGTVRGAVRYSADDLNDYIERVARKSTSEKAVARGGVA